MMGDAALSSVRVVVAEPRLDRRAVLVTALRDIDMTDIDSTGNFQDLRLALDSGNVDLLIGVDNLPEGDLNDLVRRVRQGRARGNPLTAVIVLVSEPTKERVLNAVNSGADEVLTHPYRVEDLRARILRLARNRRPFVVASEYIGPDRRGSARPNDKPAQLIPVPNLCSLARQRQTKVVSHRRQLDHALTQIHLRRVESHVQVLGRVLDGVLRGVLTMPDAARLGQLVRLVLDMEERIPHTPHAHVLHLVSSLAQLLRQLVVSEQEVNRDHMILAHRLSSEIDRHITGATPSASDAQQLADQIMAGESTTGVMPLSDTVVPLDPDWCQKYLRRGSREEAA